VANVIDWFGTIFLLGALIVQWTLFVNDVISGAAGFADIASFAMNLALSVLAIWVLAAVVSADKRTVVHQHRLVLQQRSASLGCRIVVTFRPCSQLIALGDQHAAPESGRGEALQLPQEIGADRADVNDDRVDALRQLRDAFLPELVRHRDDGCLRCENRRPRPPPLEACDTRNARRQVALRRDGDANGDEPNSEAGESRR
jgi:hypothetical protein